MNKKQFGELEELVGKAMEREPENRRSFLEQACGANSALLEQAWALVLADKELDGFMEEPLALSFAEAAVRHEESLEEDLRAIKGYQLLEKLGEGGMGLVYLAQQRLKVDRQVALKVVRFGFESKESLARFQHEKQALARLEHAHIARIYDADTTPLGRPFFTMELVTGASICDYAAQNQLDLKARIRLFLQACEGMAHAHQQGIIHRDLKPSNILVSENHGKPMVKIIDFGIARTINEEASGQLTLTHDGRIYGTPAYMAPEQLDPSFPIDTRTDVYGLGSVLYQLLTQAPPFDPKKLNSVSRQESLRILIEDDPPRASVRAAASGLSHASRLSGDLDCILAKALARNKDARYSGVSDLASDLDCHLEDRPVLARPPSITYRLSRFVRRYKLAVSVAGIVLLSLGAVGLNLWVTGKQIKTKRDLAEQSYQFLQGMIAQARIGERGADVTLREVLEDVNEDIFFLRTDLRERLHGDFGHTWFEANELKKAEEHFNAQFGLLERRLGPDHDKTLTALNYLAEIASLQDSLKKAERLYAVLQKRNRDNQYLAGQARRGFADITRRKGDWQKAVDLYRALYVEQVAHIGLDQPNTLITKRGLGTALSDGGQFEQALAHLEEVWAIESSLCEITDKRRMTTLDQLVITLTAAGYGERAERLLRTTYESINECLDPLSHHNSRAKRNWAKALEKIGKIRQAEKLYSELIDEQTLGLGASHNDTRRTLNSLGNARLNLGHYKQVVSLLGPRLTDPNWSELETSKMDARCTLGEAYLKLQDYEHALQAFDANYKASKDNSKIKKEIKAVYRGFFGYALCKQGRLEEGMLHLDQAIEKLEELGSRFLKRMRDYKKEVE